MPADKTMADRIPVRNPNEISKLRKAGEVSARILMELQSIIRPGITTKAIDDYAAELFRREKCGNAFFGYSGYPGQLCISVNEEVVHGIGGPRVLRDGDIVSLDAGAIVDGWYGDNALTVGVGEHVSVEARRLMAVTEEALFRGIEQAKQGNSLMDVCGAIEDMLEVYWSDKLIIKLPVEPQRYKNCTGERDAQASCCPVLVSAPLHPAGALCPAQVCAPGVPRLPLTPWLPPQISALLWALPLPQLHSSRPNSGVTLHPGNILVSPQLAGGDQGHIVEHRGPCSQGCA